MCASGRKRLLIFGVAGFSARKRDLTFLVPVTEAANSSSFTRKPHPTCLFAPECAQDDDLVPATEAANDRLRPLSCNSVLAVVTTALQCVKKEFPPLMSSPTGTWAPFFFFPSSFPDTLRSLSSQLCVSSILSTHQDRTEYVLYNRLDCWRPSALGLDATSANYRRGFF